jgi:hypothetical protein
MTSNIPEDDLQVSQALWHTEIPEETNRCRDQEYVEHYIHRGHNRIVDIAAYAYVMQTNVRIFFETGYVDLYILYDEEQEHNTDDTLTNKWVSIYVDVPEVTRNMWIVTSRTPQDPDHHQWISITDPQGDTS